MRQYAIKLIAGRQRHAEGSVHRRWRWVKDQERTPVSLAQIAAGLDHVAVKGLMLKVKQNWPLVVENAVIIAGINGTV